MKRFWQQAPRPRQPDSTIMQRAAGLKIELDRDLEGRLWGEVEIRCGVSDDAESLRFIRRVLTDFFERAKPDDGDDGAAAT